MCDELRIASVRRGKELELIVDGRPILAHEGETVLAALIAAGIRRLRHSRQNHGSRSQHRGALCGMGICYECRVTINGVPDQRACMTLVEPGMNIATGDHFNDEGFGSEVPHGE